MIFNLLFLLLGLALTIVGIYSYRMFKQFFSFAPSTAIYIPIIAIGVFMIIIGALSLWCTPKGVSYLLYIYAFIVFVLFLAIFTISVLFFARRDTVIFFVPISISISLFFNSSLFRGEFIYYLYIRFDSSLLGMKTNAYILLIS
jgi:hypothetical protein